MEANEITCKVVVPYKWFSRNPFRSTYFACLSMAAEMSTGILAMMHTFERSPSVSLLVTRMESVYFKKATEITVFTCNGGLEIKASIDAAIHSGIAQTCVVKSTGLNPNGETVAEFVITWSFKARQK